MKLSEAILLGSVGSHQGFGPDSIYVNSTGRCALGAALHAIGQELERTPENVGCPYRNIMKAWPWTQNNIAWPIADEEYTYPSTIYDRIWQLNDKAHWTRPQIAAWVAELEKQYDPDSQPLQKEDCHELSKMQRTVGDGNLL